MPSKSTTPNSIERPPVVAVMGHIDHGKSTLLDYIRKTNIVDTEAGGITQRISAYEVIHKTKEGKERKITFLDTPGHEAFGAIRTRGASVADVAILVVAADDGVKPQTIDALNTIKAAKIPFIVAFNKIDKEGINLDRAKTSLAEHDVYVEGFGGTIPFVAVSAKTGQGVSDLLDLIILAAELEELTGDTSKDATGIVIEANLDKKKGITASLVIKDGTLASGQFLVAGPAFAPVRIMENFLGKPIKEATFSSPVKIIGWSTLPEVGAIFTTAPSKKEAEAVALKNKQAPEKKSAGLEAEDATTLPLIIKAQEVGSLDAVKHEINKFQSEKLHIKILTAGVGDITENDVKAGSAGSHTLIIGFNVKVDGPAKSLAEKLGIEIQTFDIIYKLSEWFQTIAEARTPKVTVEEQTGLIKVLKLFGKTKDRQIIGGRVEKGSLLIGSEVKILRRDFEIGKGRVRELQHLKNKVSSVEEGKEFGAMVECKIDIAPGDKLESFQLVQK